MFGSYFVVAARSGGSQAKHLSQITGSLITLGLMYLIPDNGIAVLLAGSLRSDGNVLATGSRVPWMSWNLEYNLASMLNVIESSILREKIVRERSDMIRSDEDSLDASDIASI